LLVGLESVKLRSSELGFGPSENLAITYMVFRNILCRLLGDFVGTVYESNCIYMQCNITFKVCT
jgi:hypothetical protein